MGGLDHVVNLPVCHQGNIGAALVGLLLTVKICSLVHDDQYLHYSSAGSYCGFPFMSPRKCRSCSSRCLVEESPVYDGQYLQLLDHDVNLHTCMLPRQCMGCPCRSPVHCAPPKRKNIRGAQVHYTDYLTVLSEKERFNDFQNNTV